MRCGLDLKLEVMRANQSMVIRRERREGWSERERERKRENVCIYVYVYIHV